MSVDLHKPEITYLSVRDSHFNYTLGGIAHYHAEISILTENGYTSTEHQIEDREGAPLTIAALYREGSAVKVYEL